MRQFLKTVLRGTALAASITGATAGALHAETLTDALIAAYRNSNLLEQNRAVLRAADEGVAQAVAALRPVVSFIESLTFSSSNRTQPVNVTDSVSASLVLQATLNLYDGGSNKLGVEAAKEAVLSTRAQLKGLEQNILLSAVIAFTDLRSAQENLALARSNVRLSTEQLRAARDRFEVGEVTRTDVSQAESALARAQSQEVAARGEVLRAREAYKAEIGRYPGTLTGNARVPDIPGSLNAARATAVRGHPNIVAAQHDVSAAELGIERARAATGPSVDLSGRLSSSANTDTNGTNEDFELGLQVTQTIYAGGALRSAERQAMANRDAARAALLRTIEVIEQGVGDAWTGLAVAHAQVEATDKQIRAAQLAFDGIREEARLGARTTLDVLDSQQDLLDAQTARVDAEAALFTSFYVVLQSVGLLTAEHLRLGIPTYDPAAYYDAVKSAPVRSVQGDALDRVLKSIGKN